jgi:flagellin-like protein
MNRVLLTTVLLAVKGKTMRFIYNEKGEVNIVTTIVLIGIAITLALVFKTQAKELITSLMGTITTRATEAVTTE